MKSQKGFFIPILIIVSLIFLGIVAYFFSPESTSLKLSTASPVASFDPTTNWKTYTDSQYGFNFKYPDQFTLNEGGSEGGGTTFSNEATSFGIGKLGNIDKNELLMDFTKRNGFYDALTEKIEEKVFKFDTINGLMFVSRLGKDRYIVEYIFSNNLLVYSISFSTYDYKKTIILSDQILSTFKFVE